MRKLFLLFILLLASCTSVEKTAVPTSTAVPTPTSFPQTRPADFQIEYKWSTGSLPPAYAYSYIITIRTADESNIELQPGYEKYDPPYWQETITVNESDLDQLYAHLWNIGLFTKKWTQVEDVPVGGQSTSMEVQAFGQRISIPAYVDGEQKSDDIRTAYEEIKKLVPDSTWNELHTEQEKYSVENEEN